MTCAAWLTVNFPGVLIYVIKSYDSAITVCRNVFSEIHDLILIPSDLMLTSDTIFGDLNLIYMFI